MFVYAYIYVTEVLIGISLLNKAAHCYQSWVKLPKFQKQFGFSVVGGAFTLAATWMRRRFSLGVRARALGQPEATPGRHHYPCTRRGRRTANYPACFWCRAQRLLEEVAKGRDEWGRLLRAELWLRRRRRFEGWEREWLGLG